MPQTGSCTDLTCDKEIQRLYECHCCSRLICLKHLIEHVEIGKENQERLESLSNELITVTTTLKLITEKKLLDIEYENKLIDQSEKLRQKQMYSIDEIQTIFQQINQAIASNRFEEAIVKVEPSLSEKKNCSCICECDIEKNDQLSLKNPSEPNSPICLDLTNDTDETEKIAMTTNDEYSMYNEHESININLFDETTDAIKDDDEDEQQNKVKSKQIYSFNGRCPLTFDGAFGLTKSRHSIRFCSANNSHRIGLHAHFINKHQLKTNHARRLVEAISNKQDPKTTNLFDENEDVINHFYKIPCPFKHGMINLPGYNKRDISRVPCRCQSIIFHNLKSHFKHYHRISYDLAQTLVNHLKEIRTNNDVISS